MTGHIPILWEVYNFSFTRVVQEAGSLAGSLLVRAAVSWLSRAGTTGAAGLEGNLPLRHRSCIQWEILQLNLSLKRMTGQEKAR